MPWGPAWPLGMVPNKWNWSLIWISNNNKSNSNSDSNNDSNNNNNNNKLLPSTQSPHTEQASTGTNPSKAKQKQTKPNRSTAVSLGLYRKCCGDTAVPKRDRYELTIWINVSYSWHSCCSALLCSTPIEGQTEWASEWVSEWLASGRPGCLVALTNFWLCLSLSLSRTPSLCLSGIDLCVSSMPQPQLACGHKMKGKVSYDFVKLHYGQPPAPCLPCCPSPEGKVIAFCSAAVKRER